MSLVENTGYKIMRMVIILTIILSAIILIVVPEPKQYILGLIFGAIINLLNFRLMSITLKKSSNMDPGKIMAYIMTNYMIRYLVYGIVLYISAIADYISLLTVVIGFFMVKVAIISDAIYDTIKGKTEK